MRPMVRPALKVCGRAIRVVRDHSIAALGAVMLATLSLGLLWSSAPPAPIRQPVIVQSPIVTATALVVLPRATTTVLVQVPEPGVTIRTTVRATARATATATVTVTAAPSPGCKKHNCH